MNSVLLRSAKRLPVRPKATPVEAAEVICCMLRREHGYRPEARSGPEVWDRERVLQGGWDEAEASVYWEGGPYNWAVELSLDPDIIDAFPNLLLEPYSGWLLSFYRLNRWRM